jgi:potassium-transporting ATPase KdpC subunit
MIAHLRASAWLLVLTIILCCVLYPAFLLLVGQTVFKEQAEGSLIYDKAGKPIGSRLIAQNFTSEEYFWPRSSAVSYNAAASGASNWGGNNYQLRDRVAKSLGPVVEYGKSAARNGKKPGAPVGSDVEKWFQRDIFRGRPGIVAQWAALHPVVAENWIKSVGDTLKSQWRMEAVESFLAQWREDDPDLYRRWEKEWTEEKGMSARPLAADLVVPFFTSFARAYPGQWLMVAEAETKDKGKRKKFTRAKEGADIQATFFDMWRQEHPDVDLELVPADLVMASGSGLDPHITLKNALYQLDRVSRAWARKTGKAEVSLRQEIEPWLRKEASAPLGGLAGVKMINVLQMNMALRDAYGDGVKEAGPRK